MQDQRALPAKKYFKIGEVADLVGVEPHVLRYWETQFPQVRPHKARSGHRLYRRREVETLLVIRELLHVQRFTIAGARQALRQPGGAQSLLPRFFDAPSAALDARALDAVTLVPQRADVDATDEDGAVDDSHTRSHEGIDDALLDDEGPVAEEIVEVEAHGLEGDELRDALERQAAGDDEAEVELHVTDERPSSARAGFEGRAARGAAPGAAPARPVRPALPPLPQKVVTALSPSRRALLEDALASARAVIAVLDREDASDQAHA